MSSKKKTTTAKEDASPALVPKLRFPEFRNVEGWTEKPLKAAAEINPANAGLPESFIYIDLESVEAGKLKAKNRIAREGAPSRAQRPVERGDIIYQVVRPYQRNNLLCEFDDDENYVASTGYAQLRAQGSNRFLYQSIHTDSFVGRVIAKCTGSNYPAINSSDLAEIQLPIPPTLLEQQKIASCLSSVDELMAAQGRKVDALKTHKKGLMQQLFPREGETQPRLRFPEFQIAGEWSEEKLDDLVHLQDGFAFKSTDFVKSQQDATQVIRITDINNKNTNEDKVYIATDFLIRNKLSKYCVDDGDLLLSLTGAAGFNFFFWNGGPAAINQRTAKVTLKKKSSNSLLRLLEPLIRERINERGEGQNNNLSKEFLCTISLLVPDPDEQERIATCLSSLDALTTTESQKLEALKTHKKGLMQQLFPELVEA
jgi:type I restriction enzyme S subunit